MIAQKIWIIMSPYRLHVSAFDFVCFGMRIEHRDLLIVDTIYEAKDVFS